METFEQFCERTKMNPLDPYSLLAYSESQASALSLQNSLGTPELTLELWEAMGKAKGWGQPADQTPVATLTSAPATPAASSKAMLQRVRGILLKTKYGDFENLVNQYGSDGEISRADRRAMRKELGLNRKLMRGIAKGLNGGDASALNAYTKGLEKRSYVDNGKLITEGEGENFDPDAFNTAYESAKYKGTDMKAVANLYNLDVLNWRKNTTITYDPTKNAYMASGFNGGEAVDVTNSDWFKKDTDRQRAAQLTAYKGQVDAMDSAGLAQTYGNQWGAAGLAGTLGIDSKDLEAYNKKDELGNYVMSSEDRTAFKEKLAAALKQKLDSMRTNAEGGFDFAGNVLADQITKYLIQQQKANPEAYSYLDEVSFAPGGRYASAGKTANAGGAWSLLQKNGGTLRKRAQAYKKGGAIQYAGWGDALYGALDFVPVVGTLKQAGLMAFGDKPVSGSDWASLGLSALGDALMFTGIGAGAGAAIKGAATAGRAGIKGIALANKANKANKVVKAATASARLASKEAAAANKALLNAPRGARRAASVVKKEKDAIAATRNAEKAAAQSTAETLKRAELLATVTRNNGMKLIGQGLKPTLKPGWRNPITAGWKKTALGAVVGLTGRNMGASERAAWEEYIQQADLAEEQPIEDITPNVIPGSANSGSDNQPAYTPNLEYSPYFSELILIGGHKNGGNINMTNVNYFLEGGAMAPQAASAAAPAQGGQDIQTQVMQLVLAAMSGDKLATQAIQLIMQAAQLGDQQAAQIAQMIQEVAKQMQGQAQAAKYGAKLSYLKSLKSGCPEGYEVSYNKKGGRLCKECVAKAATAITEQKKSGEPADMFKTGGELKKKLACGGKKLKNGAELDKKGGKACAHSSKAECKKKHANGGTLTLEGLQAAYKSLNA